MTEFKITSSPSKLDVVWRPLLWICATLSLALMIFSLAGENAAVTSVRYPLAGLAIFLVIMAAGLGILAAMRSGMNEARRKIRFVLTDNSIILRRPGWSDVEIPFLEITSITERRSGTLQVKSSDQTIFIPSQVERFHDLRAELARRREIRVG